MGECAYYLKAAFPTEKKALAAAKKLDEFFLEAMDAHAFYQKGRDDKETFWPTFQEKFPLVTDYVKESGLWGGNPNELSGELDFGQDENNETLVQGTSVGWGDCSVWHMADWSNLCAFIKKKYGAIKVVWDQEENGCGSLDSLQLYDWEHIVTNILKHKELHPMLIGINTELDILLETTMKKGKK